ncbi:uncharacterized protein LOC124969539 isoform X2 [Sciurus carolinensis]|uniref:uncharacterized protein LOC124969539 isoform X2 n=1 Tax=Sciurus carolinensis TaxID=30640 RepID=UPI001FB4FE83|nr:uncharacterized protein LOC124969539 isoform X2 [Sciurus carolinensis]
MYQGDKWTQSCADSGSPCRSSCEGGGRGWKEDPPPGVTGATVRLRQHSSPQRARVHTHMHAHAIFGYELIFHRKHLEGGDLPLKVAVYRRRSALFHWVLGLHTGSAGMISRIHRQHIHERLGTGTARPLACCGGSRPASGSPVLDVPVPGQALWPMHLALTECEVLRSSHAAAVTALLPWPRTLQVCVARLWVRPAVVGPSGCLCVLMPVTSVAVGFCVPLLSWVCVLDPGVCLGLGLLDLCRLRHTFVGAASQCPAAVPVRLATPACCCRLSPGTPLAHSHPSAPMSRGLSPGQCRKGLRTPFS